MTDEELRDYVIRTEKQFELLARRFDAALNLLMRSVRGDREVAERANEILAMLQNYAFETPAPSYSLSELRGPPVKVMTALHLIFIEAARDYYRALGAGTDPGPAEEFLNGLAVLRSDDPAWVAHREELLAKVIPMLEMQRFTELTRRRP